MEFGIDDAGHLVRRRARESFSSAAGLAAANGDADAGEAGWEVVPDNELPIEQLKTLRPEWIERLLATKHEKARGLGSGASLGCILPPAEAPAPTHLPTRLPATPPTPAYPPTLPAGGRPGVPDAAPDPPREEGVHREPPPPPPRAHLAGA